jgi:hypothetical protein
MTAKAKKYDAIKRRRELHEMAHADLVKLYAKLYERLPSEARAQYPEDGGRSRQTLIDVIVYAEIRRAEA